MISCRIAALALSALVAVNAQPLHPRAEAVPSDIGFIMNNIADFIDNSSIMTQIQAAATSLMSVYNLPNQQEAGEEIMSSLMASLDAANNPEEAAHIASAIVSLLEDSNEIPTEVADEYGSALSVLKEPKVSTEITAIINELVAFISGVRKAMPEAFEDVPTASEDVDSSTRTSTKSNSSPLPTSSSATTGSDTTNDSSEAEGKSLNSSGSINSKDTDSSSDNTDSSSSAGTTRFALGMLPLTIATGMMAMSALF
ncbi:hypothetical protein GGI07_001146 [Coemansia sp. Benny D115]|nr:hypothetical protein GGI07_001146 [Coemansia sp. Benny D115]